MRIFVYPGVIGKTPAAPFSGYQLKFFDDFVAFSGSPAGTNDWSTTYLPDQDRTLGNGQGTFEQQCYIDTSVAPFISPFSIVNGTILRITASKASVTGANSLGVPYNSGVITSATTFNMQYGYFEIRAKLPAGQGLWSAGWARLPGGYTAATEIDGFEMLGNAPTVIDQNVHFGTIGSPQQLGPNSATGADSSAAYQTYGWDWDPTHITFYINRVQTVQYATPVGFNVPMCLIVDFAVGGTFPGNPDGTTVFPAFLDIDYCAVWANASSTNISGTRAIT